jgi:hypothetical protein
VSHRAPTSSCTGQYTQRPAPYLSRDRIQDLMSVSPHSISRTATQLVLATVTAWIIKGTTCSRWSMAVQFNQRGRGAWGELKDAITNDQRAWTNLEQAGRGEGVSAVAETGLGEVRNSWSLVNDWSQVWVCWLRDNMAQQTRPSIYRIAKRWPGIWTKTRGGVAEPPELFQLKCPSRTLKGSNTLNRNNPSVPRI